MQVNTAEALEEAMQKIDDGAYSPLSLDILQKYSAANCSRPL